MRRPEGGNPVLVPSRSIAPIPHDKAAEGGRSDQLIDYHCTSKDEAFAEDLDEED